MKFFFEVMTQEKFLADENIFMCKENFFHEKVNRYNVNIKN
jgi:hypothetical protein